DGKSFARKEVPRQITSLTRAAANDIWAATREGVLEHFDGTAWTEVDAQSKSPLAAIWASGPHDVWAVGASGTILHFDGAKWTRATSPSTANLHGVRGRAKN